MDDILKDKRFAHVAGDPRFRKMPVGQRKVKIDNRFKQMFTDKKFKLKYTVDKRGKPMNLSTNENLQKYYELSDSESLDEDEHGSTVDDHKEFDNAKPKDIATEIPEKSRKVKFEIQEKRNKAKFEPASSVDYARGEGVFSSSSSEEEDSGDDDEGGVDDKDISKIDHRWGEVDDNVIELQESSHRLAVCNMDWDRMKAKDIFMLLNSFKPTNGLIKSVKIYPSEFGKQRMAEEEIQGPKELKELKEESDDEEFDKADLVEKEGTLYNTEKLRQYQLKRLKYYYAVVDCDSVGTADQIYKDCDNMEYESSATRLDLRFIPDETEFSDDDVRSFCNEVPSDYQPKFFSNAALSQSKVDLTWDETDRDRMELTSRPFIGKGEDINDEDLATYLASSSDDEAPGYTALLGDQGDSSTADTESPDEDSQVDKYRKLLLEIDSEEKKKERDVEMEITWEPGLRDVTEGLIKKKKKSTDSTVWETYLQKKKERKKQKTHEKRKARYIQNENEKEGDSVTDKGVNVGDTAVEDDDKVGEGQQAFSDDELPDDVDKSDPFFITESNKSEQLKTKKKGKMKQKHTEEEVAMDANEKAKLSLLVMDIDDKKHFNLKDLMQKEGKKKKKKKMQKQNNEEIEDDFTVNVADPRFNAVYDSHLFNIDPSAPEFRKTKGTEAMIMEKLQRSGNMDKKKRKIYTNNEETVKKLKVDETVKISSTGDDLASLLKSVKAKTIHFHTNKIRK